MHVACYEALPFGVFGSHSHSRPVEGAIARGACGVAAQASCEQMTLRFQGCAFLAGRWRAGQATAISTKRASRVKDFMCESLQIRKALGEQIRYGNWGGGSQLADWPRALDLRLWQPNYHASDLGAQAEP